MKYPQEFIGRCKAVYPTWTELHVRLERGDTFAGRYLDDARHAAGVSTNEVLSATSLEEVQAQARLADEKTALYVEWGRLYDEQFPR
jgi:hypothetical protein